MTEERKAAQSPLRAIPSPPLPPPPPPYTAPSGAFPAPAAFPSAPSTFVLSGNRMTLFSLCLGIIFLGLCAFGGGVLLGIWIEEKRSHEREQTSFQAQQNSLKVASKLGLHSDQLFEFMAAMGGNAGTLGSALQRAQDRGRERAAQETAAPKGVVGPAEGGSSALPVQSPPDKKPAAPAGEGYTLQLGTFAAKENALDLVANLKAKFLATTLTEETDGEGNVFYHVRSGNYPDREAAKAAADGLWEKEKISAVILPLKEAAPPPAQAKA